MTNINCRYFYQGTCNHSSAQRAFFGNRFCILTEFNDPRIGACRMQLEHERPKCPPPPPKRTERHMF